MPASEPASGQADTRNHGRRGYASTGSGRLGAFAAPLSEMPHRVARSELMRQEAAGPYTEAVRAPFLP